MKKGNWKRVELLIFISVMSLGLSGCGIGRIGKIIKNAAAREEVSEQAESSEQEEVSVQAGSSETTEPSEQAGSSVTEEASEQASGNEDAELKEILAKEANSTEDEIRYFIMDDFDGDGENEAFAIIGSEPEYDFDEKGLVSGSVWFVNSNGAKMLQEGMGMGIKCESIMLGFDGIKYPVFYDVYATGVASYVYEVKGKEVSETPFSGCGTVQEQTEDDRFEIVDSSYDAEYDPEIEGLLGHTWKSYYFYYDRDTKSIKEYGGAEITQKKAEEIAGKDIVSESVTSEYELGTIYYRENGIININFSKTDDNGAILYYHRNWNNEKGCYVDDYNGESDELQSGTYRSELCPVIAEYPKDI